MFSPKILFSPKTIFTKIKFSPKNIFSYNKFSSIKKFHKKTDLTKKNSFY